MEILILLSKIIFILYFVGYGFTAVLIPKKLRKDSFFIIPWIGLIFITVIGIALSMAQVPLAQSKYVIFAIGSVMIIYSFLIKKTLFSFSKDTILVGILTIVCLLFNLYPLLIKFGYATTISLSNLDPLSYVNVGEHLINNPIFNRPEILSTQPHFRAVGDLLYYGYRWGSPLILGFFSTVLGLRSYKIYSILITLLFSLSFPLVYLLAKLLINKSNRILMFLIFLTYGMNSIILYMLYNVFFAQFIFAGIFILTIILLYSYFSDESFKKLQFNTYDLLIALAFSSLSSIYSEGLVFAAAPMFIFLFLKLFFKERSAVFISMSKIAILVLIINPFTIGTSLLGVFKLFFSSTKPSFIGWEKVRNAIPLEMTGFYNLFFYRVLPKILGILISIPIVGICISGILRIKNKFFIISYLFIFGLFYLVYWFVYPNYYLHLKLVSYLLFIFSVIFSIGLVSVLEKFKSKHLLLLSLTFFSFLAFRSSYRTIYQLYYHPRSVDRKLISLEQLNNNEKIQSAFFTSDVYLGEYDLWKRLWQEYLLSGKKIITRTNYLDEKNKENVKLVLSEKEVQEYDHKKIIYKSIIWENEYYKLGEIEPTDVAKDLQKKL